MVSILLAGCGARHSKQTASGGRTRAVYVDQASIASVKAHVLVDAKGYPLYVFARDHQRHVTCTGTCAGRWPPLKVPDGSRPVAGQGVTAKLLGVDRDPAGGRVATYNGWPLYTYVSDLELGPHSHVATGEGLDLNGGFWYLIRPDGQLIIRHHT